MFRVDRVVAVRCTYSDVKVFFEDASFVLLAQCPPSNTLEPYEKRRMLSEIGCPEGTADFVTELYNKMKLLKEGNWFNNGEPNV